MSDDQESFDASAVIEAVTESLLGQAPTLTRLDVAKKAGLPPEVNAARWRYEKITRFTILPRDFTLDHD